jgi:hypothetical protein
MLDLAYSVKCMVVAHKNRVRFPNSTKGEKTYQGRRILLKCRLNKMSVGHDHFSPQKNSSLNK